VLRASAARARLTVATSHYEEVKALAGGNKDTGVAAMAGAANAAVEFDSLTLRPTDRLLWRGSSEPTTCNTEPLSLDTQPSTLPSTYETEPRPLTLVTLNLDR